MVERFLGKTKPSTAMYSNVHEKRRQVLTTKSPTRSMYARSLSTHLNALVVTGSAVFHCTQLQEKTHPVLPLSST